MSKAFVQNDTELEDDSDDVEPVPSTGKRYITPQGFQRLQGELRTLWNDERPRVTKEVAEAAAQGDRSENAEYIYGKRRLREIDRRIRYLTKLLDRLTVVEPDGRPRDAVFFGARVTVEDDDGAVFAYRIVGPDEFDVKVGDISVDSPMARALLGKRVGDTVCVERPKGAAEYTLTRID